MRVVLEVEIEQKDEHGAVDNNPPDPNLVAAYVHDYMRDITRGEYSLNWMVRNVKVAEG